MAKKVDEKKVDEKNDAVAMPVETAVSNVDAQSMLDLIKSTGFLPRLQLMTSAGQQCKSGAFPINHYALVEGSAYQDIGTDVDVLVVAMRSKAIDMSDDENIISCYDPKMGEDRKATGLFREIQERSEEQNSGCMWGPEFLVYLPNEQRFATFFMGSKTARNDAASMINRLRKPATLRAKKIPNKKYGDYFSVAITACSTPFDPPNPTELQDHVEKFLNPPTKEEPEKADKAATEQAR